MDNLTLDAYRQTSENILNMQQHKDFHAEVTCHR